MYKLKKIVGTNNFSAQLILTMTSGSLCDELSIKMDRQKFQTT